MLTSFAFRIWLGLVVVLAATAALRFLLIEPHEIGHLCLQTDAPWWCAAREGVAITFRTQAFGWLSLAAGLWAWWRSDARWAAVAMLVGAGGLMLYNTDLAAPGVLLGIIALAKGGRPRAA
jgi:hypothetical protein